MLISFACTGAAVPHDINAKNTIDDTKIGNIICCFRENDSAEKKTDSMCCDRLASRFTATTGFGTDPAMFVLGGVFLAFAGAFCARGGARCEQLIGNGRCYPPPESREHMACRETKRCTIFADANASDVDAMFTDARVGADRARQRAIKACVNALLCRWT